MTLTTSIFVAQNVIKLLILTHTCLKTYQRVNRLYRWFAPPSAALWNSFVYVEVLPEEEEYVLVPNEISAFTKNGGQEETAPRDLDEKRARKVTLS